MVLRNPLVSTCTHFRGQITTYIDARHEAVFGIALYCYSIVLEIYEAKIGHTITARMGLRTILECYITLKYLIKKNEPELWIQYRNYGTGQAKLALLKLNELDETTSNISVDSLDLIANEDKSADYLNINIGQWNKSNLRQLSEESDTKNIYDKYYPWLSAYSHGHWSPIREANYKLCVNMLHRLHRTPRIKPKVLGDIIPDALELIDSILDIVDEQYPTFPYRTNGVKDPLP